MPLNEVDIGDLKCPACSRTVPLAAPARGEGEPGPGDVAVCWSCRNVLVFTDDMALRLAEADEILDLPVPMLIDIVRVVSATPKPRKH